MRLFLVLAALLLFVPFVSADEAPAAIEPAPVTAAPAQAADPLANLQAGENRVTLTHSRTCCPVEVCFCLKCPTGCVKHGKNHIRIKQSGRDVVIHFQKKGGVRVTGG